MPLVLTESSDGVTFAVKVVPAASRSRLVGPHGDGVKVTVAAPPAGGAANAAVIAVLAAAIGVPSSQIRIKHGHGTPRKLVVVSGVNIEALRGKLIA